MLRNTFKFRLETSCDKTAKADYGDTPLYSGD
jgi:hypothetical protein